MAASPYPGALEERIAQVERRLEGAENRIDHIRNSDRQDVLMVEVRNLKAEVRWLRYTLIGFIPIMAGVIVAVLKATGQG